MDVGTAGQPFDDEDTLEPPVDRESVARAIWEINKGAKRYRDEAEQTQDQNHRSELFRRRDECYRLKTQALFAAIRKGWVSLHAVHQASRYFNNFDGVISETLACLDISGLLFHCKAVHVDAAHTVINLPDNWRVPAAPEGTYMDLSAARVLIERFIKENFIDDESELKLEGVVLRASSGPTVCSLIELGLPKYQELKSEIDRLKAEVQHLDERIETIASEADDSEGICECDDENDEHDHIREGLNDCDGAVHTMIDDGLFTQDLAEQLSDLKDWIFSSKMDLQRRTAIY